MCIFFLIKIKKKKTNPEGIQVRIVKINIDRVKSFKFLAIIIDSNLNWNLNYICQKVSKNIGIIRCVSHFLPQKPFYSILFISVSFFFLW